MIGGTLTERFPLWPHRPWLTGLLAVGLSAIGLVLRFAFDDLLPPGFPFVTFFPAVILTGFLLGTRNGVISAVLCGLAAFQFFVRPAVGDAMTSGVIAAMLFYLFVVATDLYLIDLMQRATRVARHERMRSDKLAQSRELMFRELQHRVSNNLQVAAGLMALQKRTIDNADARGALDEAARRLSTIGRISRSLYDPDGAALGLDTLIRRLVDDIGDASGRSDITIALTAAQDIDIDSDSAIPVALIVAEAVANAIEHGFATISGGRIDVAMARSEDRIEIAVTDTGSGIPEGFDVEASESLGLRIATMFAKQLGGVFSLQSESGRTVARLSIPARARP
jgi:two-component sensor histidine kinase